MPNESLYPPDMVFKLLLLAYKAGFEGPMEMSEETCRDIMASSTHASSDVSVIELMQKRVLESLTANVAPRNMSHGRKSSFRSLEYDADTL
jgi:hypothetical protein